MGTSTHQNEDTEIHMRMNWQLWIYYDLCKGNEQEAKFWPKVFDIMRTTYKDVPESDPGADNWLSSKLYAKLPRKTLRISSKHGDSSKL